MATKTIPVPLFDLVVFGATGDLSRRKLIPALYHRLLAGQMPPDARIIGVARTDLAREAFQNLARRSIEEFVPAPHRKAEDVERFMACLSYVTVDATEEQGWQRLADILNEAPDRVRAFYLSVSPHLFKSVTARLSAEAFSPATCRIVVEKPLGHDFASARDLNTHLSALFPESQIYRIDHYLGKETVQNLMALRFANALFEPLWNARHIDHVQITVAESLGVEGRGAYYDTIGALRDMVQNHLMQLLCLTAMEPPGHFEPNAVRDEKLKVIKALQPMTAEQVLSDTVRGQYGGYLHESGHSASLTETFAALKVQIANWRWSGTPFYLRTGKKLRARMSEIAVIFKDIPHSIFPAQAGLFQGNVLSIRLQPDEGITLRMTIKEPGPGGMRLTEVPLDMTFADDLGAMPDAYERLIMDVIRGDQTLFMRGDEVEAAWAWTDGILSEWDHLARPPQTYDPGGSGPEDSLMLMHRDGRRWRSIEP